MPPEQASHSISPAAVAELATRPQWVVWQYVTRKGKRTKPPYNALTHGLASSTDPATWTDYARANLERVRRKYPGIGYVFAADDPYTGVDLDKAIDPETGELRAWAREIVRRADTYTEISPSGLGVKLWLRALWAGGWGKWNLPDGAAIEVYDRERYFTVTARHLAGTPETINDGAALLEWLAPKPELPGLSGMRPRQGGLVVPIGKPAENLSDDALLQRAFDSSIGDKIKRLWAGDLSDADGDHSAADWALIDHLLYWTDGDTLRADRLFRRSGLMRPKWDERHYSDGSSYGGGTLSRRAALRRAKAGGYVRPAAEAVAPPPGAEDAITAAALKLLVLPQPRHIVEGYLPEGMVIIAGRSKVGKSWQALNIGAAVASGGVALGGVKVEQGDVLYLAMEDGRARIQGRLRKQLGDADWPERLSIRTWMPNQTQPRCWEILEAWVTASAHPVLLIVDTLQRIRPPSKKGVNIYQQDSEDAAPWHDFARRHRLCVWVLHHTNKLKLEEGMDPFDAISGSTALPAVADAAIVFWRQDKSKAVAYLRGRDIEETTLLMQWSPELFCWAMVGDAEEIAVTAERQEVMALFEERDALSVAQCAELLGIQRDAARKRLVRMYRDGLLIRTPEGMYRKNPHAGVPQRPVDPLSGLSGVSGSPSGAGQPDTDSGPADPQTRESPPLGHPGQSDTTDTPDTPDTFPNGRIVELRRDCRVCGGGVPTTLRSRGLCSPCYLKDEELNALVRCNGGCGAYLTAADRAIGYCRKCGGPKEDEEPF